MSSKSEDALQKAYNFLKVGDSYKAREILSVALEDDLENKEILFSLRCTSFWTDKLQQISELSSLFEQGEQIISQWKQFSTLVGAEFCNHEQCVYAVKAGIFSLVLECYQQLLRENVSSQKSLIFSRLGLCYKKLGDYENALLFLGEANTISPDEAQILAEMADCYALCGEEVRAKVLFREAFFVDAQAVDIQLLESELFCRLYDEVLKTGKTGAIATEWIPVQGVLLGVLNVKRELRALEAGKLKQTIYALENELKDVGSEPEILIPRLINHYFWLIDHYITVHEDRSKINEILLKIKLLDSDVFDRYAV